MIPFSIMFPTILFWHDGLYVCALYAIALICGFVYALYGEKGNLRYITGGQVLIIDIAGYRAYL